MDITVKLFSMLRDCLPPDASQGQVTISFPEGTTLGDLVTQLGIDRRLGYSPQEVISRAGWQIIVNDSFESNIERGLQDGDRIQIFPPVAGG